MEEVHSDASAGLCVLVVDDEPEMRYLLRCALEQTSECREVLEAGDGQAALQVLHEHRPRPDLILLDLQMPHLDGYGFLERQKADPELRAIPVLVVSGLADRDAVMRAYDLHANAYLSKPLAPTRFEELMAAVHAFWLRQNRFSGPPPDA